jgi:hypothetical protein
MRRKIKVEMIFLSNMYFMENLHGKIDFTVLESILSNLSLLKIKELVSYTKSLKIDLEICTKINWSFYLLIISCTWTNVTTGGSLYHVQI